MKLQDTIRIAKWLHTVWPYYLSYRDERVQIPIQSENNPTNKLRASQLFECSKKLAAERLGLIDKQDIPFDLARKFDLGVRVAESVQEAIQYGVNIQPKSGLKIDVSFESDNRIENEYMSGTPDALITIKDDKLPIEIKHTSVYGGYSWTQVQQLIGYMELYNVDFGILYTVYPAGEVSHQVWIVQRTDDHEGWYFLDMNGKPVKSVSKHIPHTHDGTVFMTRMQYNDLISQHTRWYMYLLGQHGDEKNAEVPTDIELKDWRCGEFNDPYIVKRASGGQQKGEIKNGTGTFKVRCPLARFCYPDMKIGPDEKEVSIEFDGSKYIRRTNGA